MSRPALNAIVDAVAYAGFVGGNRTDAALANVPRERRIALAWGPGPALERATDP